MSAGPSKQADVIFLGDSESLLPISAGPFKQAEVIFSGDSKSLLPKRIPADLGEKITKNVLGRMQDRAASKLAKSDPLILQLGRFWWRHSSGRDLNRHCLCSEKMLRAAKLLLCVKQLLTKEGESSENLKMWNVLRP